MAMEAWEIPHEDFTPAARLIMKQQCQSVAGEAIGNIAEDVQSILRLDETGPGQPFVGSFGRHYSIHGATFTHPDAMFYQLGLHFVERVQRAGEQFYTGNNFARFHLRSNYREGADEVRSSHAVIFKSLLTQDEANLGLFGRRIEVVSIGSGQPLARRTEFFWVRPQRNNKRGSGGFVCPSLGPGQATPQSFLSRVLNPVSYGCFYRAEPLYDPVHFRHARAREACDKSFWSSKEPNP